MKKTILATLTVACALFIVSCGNSTTNEESHQAPDPSVAEVTAPLGVEIKDATLNAVYHEYLNVNLALVNGNEEEAKIAANTLALGAKDLVGGQVITRSALKMTEAGTINEQRAAFSDLSDALIVLIKETGLMSGELYVDYCPMAFNNAGAYWLSSEKGIKNPYFGASMLTCGETKETL